MPTFRMEDLENGNNRIDTVSIPYRSEKSDRSNKAMGQVARRSLDETKKLIKNIIKKEKRAMTFREIAHSIERKPTPHLRQILKDMIDSGELVQKADDAPAGNMDRFWYDVRR
jgi:hypothetical protein